MNRKKLEIFLLVIILFNIFVPRLKVNAKVNTDYFDINSSSETNNNGEIAASSIVLKWAGEILYTLSYGIENAGANIVKAFTGKAFFPWADKIIFNTIPILDINFINPAPGSLMKDTSGNITFIGNVIRNIYFTSLSISLGFLSIVIAVAAIRLAVASMASEKAKYKEAIAHWLTCLILLFTLHYAFSFMFYLNEKLVESASKIASSTLASSSDSVVNNLKNEADKDNEKIVTAFVNKCAEKALIEKIPIVGEIVSWAKDLINAIGKAISAAWKWLTGDTNKEDEISVDQLKKMYPKKQDYIDWFKDTNDPEHEVRMNVAAYLLKNKYYRANYLEWIAGNDTNSLTESGVEGVGRNILIACNDCLGIVDTGYKALRTLFTSVAMITYKGNGTDGQPFESVAAAVNTDGASEEAKTDLENQKQKSKLNDDGKTSYYYQIIKSTDDYNEFLRDIDEKLNAAEKQLRETNDDNQKKKLKNDIFGYNLSKIYAAAYYEYVYQGDDKYKPEASDTISTLGEYFRKSSWYVDTDRGDWAPTTINVVSAMCYAIFIIQSLMFLIAYFKRFFYVIILAIIGPIVVVYDFLVKSI